MSQAEVSYHPNDDLSFFHAINPNIPKIYTQAIEKNAWKA